MSPRPSQTSTGTSSRVTRVRWTALTVTAAAATVGVTIYLGSAAHELHDSNHALQQLDLLYLNEPAPGLDRLPIKPGRPVVLVFCARQGCPLPMLEDAQVLRSTDPRLAARYALQGEHGRVGPGYALIDSFGRVRYRTFDPGVAGHEAEIRILVEGLS